MKTLQEHLGQIILAIAAVALIAGVVVCLATPVGDTISAIFNKTQEQGTGNIWDKGQYEIPYTVKLKANIPEAGTVEFTSEGHSGTSLNLRGEQTLTLKATCNTGYQFLGWYIGDTLLSEDAEYTTTVNGATTIVGHFAQAFGLYKTGTNYTEIVYTWEELIDNGYITVTDGAITASTSTGTNGDLLLPTDGSITAIGNQAFKNSTGTGLLKSINIPDSVTSIGQAAFSGCTILTSVTFGENSQLTAIGSAAFGGCPSLTSIEIPASVTTIAGNAFFNCNALTSITVVAENTKYHSAGNCIIETASKTLVVGCKGSVIPTDGSVTTIGQNAFYGCTGLTSIEIPDSVTTIDGSTYFGAFKGCTSLTNVTFGENSQLTSIGTYAFDGCTSLTSIEIPDSVTSIGSFAFNGCTGLTNVTFGENSQLTSIGNSAFRECTSLTSIEIPASVTIISSYAFSNCTSLTTVTVLTTDVPTLQSNNFNTCSALTTIYVPAGCGDAYKAATNWSTYASIIVEQE